MDIYHPVVLFKFSTKRGAAPLLSRLFVERRKKSRAQRDVRPVSSQSVTERRGTRMEAEEGEQREEGTERRSAGLKPRCSLETRPLFLPAPLLAAETGGFRTEHRLKHDEGTEPRTHQRN